MKGETLADWILKESYRPHTYLKKFSQSRPIEDLRNVILTARKFVLDEQMSSFLADLSLVPFKGAKERGPEIMNSLRHSAKLPYPKTWIEFDYHAFRKRSVELKAQGVNGPLGDVDECPSRIAILLEEHHEVKSAVRMVEFFDGKEKIPPTIMPFSHVWQTTDEPLPWHADTDAGMFTHSIVGFFSTQYGILYDNFIKHDLKQQIVCSSKTFYTHPLVVETSGIGRYMICLLAALDDVPVLQNDKVQSRGFLARGKYRKFMDYSVLRLNIPIKTNTQKLAKKLIVMARRRAHTVRGHWRNHEHSLSCQPSFHTWTASDVNNRSHCTTCGAKRTWIKQHQRGDALLGYVTHDYVVGHEI
jgi:hypothetical protein